MIGITAALMLQAGQLMAAEYFLRADTTTLTLPNGSNVVMWGFARDTAFGAMDGVVTVPGPMLTVMPGDSTLIIHLDNRLPEPVSVMIPGQSIVPTPVRLGNGRARSFTTETPTTNGAPVDYVWTNLRPGTFLYESATHPSVQVQMGLYGCVRKDYAYGQSYPGVLFNAEVILFYSEVDPALHDAVATGQYGPGQAMPSTVNYLPKYFLINGHPYTNGLTPIPSGQPGDNVMIHFLNAGLETHVPIVNNAYLRLIAEDGFPYPYPKDQYSVFLAAGKTIDALFSSSTSNVFAVYDRRLDMMNGATATPGGMLTYLGVSSPVCPTNLPQSWITAYFGAGPIYPLGTTGPLDDPDGDGVNNLGEYIAGTDPTNALSVFRIASIASPAPSNTATVVFETTVTGRYYSLDYSTNLITGIWEPVYTNVPGYPGSMELIVPHSNDPAGFFRVNVDVCP